MLKRMKRLAVIVVLLLAGLIAATAISDELEVDKGVKPVAKEEAQINLPLYTRKSCPHNFILPLSLF